VFAGFLSAPAFFGNSFGNIMQLSGISWRSFLNYGAAGCYGLHRLIEKRGRDAKLIDWLGELTAECPKKIAHNTNDPCGARCRDLARVL
jgi:hypothetical protein